MSEDGVLKGLLAVLAEAYEGSKPGEGSSFVDSTKADGSRNSGVFATLDRLSAAQASEPTALAMSVAAQAAHVAYHLEVTVRWEQGERGPFDWAGSFAPATVDEAAWKATRERVRKAYDALVALAKSAPALDEGSAAGIAGSIAHAAYHLGAIRQIAKLATK